jgi:hypothetical protein
MHGYQKKLLFAIAPNVGSCSVIYTQHSTYQLFYGCDVLLQEQPRNRNDSHSYMWPNFKGFK